MLFYALGFRVNTTPSYPQGLYRLDSTKVENVERGQLVLFCPSDDVAKLGMERGYIGSGPCPSGGRPLAKAVVGLPGDEIRIDGRVWVNGILQQNSAVRTVDSAQRPMPQQTSGLVIADDELFVMSDYIENSFDSRYFGPVRAKTVRGRLHPIWTVGGT